MTLDSTAPTVLPTTSRPAALNWEQKLSYEANGFLKFDGFLSSEELAGLHDAFEQAYAFWLADPARPGDRSPNSHQIVGIIEYDDRFLQLLAHSRMFPVLRELLGDDIAMIDNDGHVKPARCGTHIAWHHDVGLRGVYHPLSTLMVKVFYLLTDIDPDGGVTAFVPGSHRFPPEYRYPQVENPEEMPGHVRMTGSTRRRAPGPGWLSRGHGPGVRRPRRPGRRS